MKKLTTFVTLAAVATAAGVALADTPTAPYDKLELTQAAQFKDETSSEVSGDLKGDAVKTLAQTDVALKEVEQFDVTFKPTFCDDVSDLPKPVGAKVGFAFVDETTAAYYNGTWRTVTMTSAVAEGTPYTVHFDIDRRATQKQARIKLGDAVLVGWFNISDLKSNAIAVYGTGTIVSMAGTTYTISAEVIVINPDGEGNADIKFTADQMTDLATKFGVPAAQVPTKLAEVSAVNGQTALVNYILFGKTTVTASDAPIAKGVPGEATEGKVKVALQGLDVQTVAGATVKYRLMGSANSTDWHPVVAPQASATFEFPATTTDRFFKVVTVITYATAQ